MTRLTAVQARRIAVAAQGFGQQPARSVKQADLRRLIRRIQALQLRFGVFAVRAHYAPVFSRLGPDDRGHADAAAWSHTAGAPGLLVEYWAHEAALMAVEDWPLMRWRMREYVHGRWGVTSWLSNPRAGRRGGGAAVGELGPSTAGQIEAHLETATRRGKGRLGGTAAKPKLGGRGAVSPPACWTTAHRVGFARITTWSSGYCRLRRWPGRSMTPTRCGS